MKMRFLFIAALAIGIAYAQDEGGGGGGRGGGVLPSMPGRGPTQVLDRMENLCKLTKEQKKAFKSVMDAAQKEAEPVRKQLLQNEKDLQAAAVKAKSSADVKAQIDTLSAASSLMAQIEIKTFAQLYKSLDDDQKKVGGGQLFNTFFNHQYFSETSGIFMGKNWQDR